MTTDFYPPMPRSPVTELSAGIDAIDTDIPVVNAARLPAGPNKATIGGGEDSETVRYTDKAGNTLTGCTRGFDPAGSAKAWDSGTAVARLLTAQDITVLQGHAEAVTGAQHGAVSAATVNMIVRRDSAGRARVVAPSHDDDIATKKYVDDEIGGVGGLALGETSATAYRGDRGKTAYDHSLLASATNNPHGLGANTLKAGSGASATGTNAIALGKDSVATGNNSAALGDGANASDSSAVALGRLAKASEVGAVALGVSAESSTYGAIAIGLSSRGTGAGSIGVGSNALATGNSTVAVGAGAEATHAGATSVGVNAFARNSNSTAIGYQSNVATANMVRIGDWNVTSIGGQVGWTTVSDERDKKDIKECEHGLDFINKVKPVKFKMDPRERYDDKKPDGSKADKDYSYGFVAQELLKAQKGTDIHIVNETDPEKLGVTAETLIPVLVKAVQDLSKEVGELKRQVK